MHFKNPKLKQQEEGNLQFIKTTQCVCKDIMFLGEGYRYIFECKDGIIFSYEVTRTDYAERAIDVGQTVYAQAKPLSFVPCNIEDIAAQAKLADDIMFNATMS